ncbi:MAG: 3-dehydroquinate synthase [Acidimicrobiia bacterium]|nr:3-dehydroquinate synthase [Acidimicrobiia bacterium]
MGDSAAERIETLLSGRRRVAVVSQSGVAAVHARPLTGALDRAGIAHEMFLVGDGEEHKTLATVEDLARRFARSGLLRGDAVVALGGGLVGDVAGFAAATYHRGIDVVQVPTTLLAMVDAAIGGKTGVNLPEGKNLVGAFHQPLGVLADPAVLATLPDREFRCGLGEVAKYALLGDDVLVDLLRERCGSLLARDREVLTEVVALCAADKARIVEADEGETSGLRARLNYGHTLAHAIETVAGYALAHGEAVGVGLVFAANLAAALERVGLAEVDRHHGMVAALGLPVEAPPGLRADDLIAVMARDKKSTGDLTFVLDGPGGIETVEGADERAVRTALAAIGVDA